METVRQMENGEEGSEDQKWRERKRIEKERQKIYIECSILTYDFKYLEENKTDRRRQTFKSNSRISRIEFYNFNKKKMLFAATNSKAYYIKNNLIMFNLNFIKTDIINVILIL